MFGRHTHHVSIDGLTCDHCVHHVSDALNACAGVKKVSVDLVPGGTSTATVVASRRLDEAELASAVTEAGYTVVTVSA